MLRVKMSESWYGRKSPQHACYYCVHCVCCGRLMISRWILTPSCKHWTVSTCDRSEILLLCHGATATLPSQWNLLTWYYTCSYAIAILTAIWSSFVFMFLWGQKCASTAICQKKGPKVKNLRITISHNVTSNILDSRSMKRRQWCKSLCSKWSPLTQILQHFTAECCIYYPRA